MTDSHPITPPRELVDSLQDLGNLDAIELAYQAGADHELEACCEWLRSSLPGYDKHYADCLHTARRPKPPSLKEQSIALIDKIQGNKEMWDIRDLDVIRQALESLPE